MSSHRIAGLDMARACAMLYVIGGQHMISYRQIAANRIVIGSHVTIGVLGVFCFSSGYLCAISLQKHPKRS